MARLLTRWLENVAIALYLVSVLDGGQDPRRKPIKTFVNAMLNDEQGNYRLTKTKQALTGLTHEQLKDKLFETYEWLEEAIHAGIDIGEIAAPTA